MFETLFKTLQTEINQALGAIELPFQPKYLYEPIRYVIAGGGKRLRPILVHLAGNAYQADSQDLLHAGLAVELLHNFTLVHDDIMDQDYQRHGQQTVHDKWDESTAILSGDGIYVVSQLLIAKVKTNTMKAIRAFNESTLIVCEGQAYDKEFENNHEITIDDYMLMIGKKTGWLIGLCAELGGILSNQDKKTNSKLQSFGLNLGKAFQIQDDILEIFGDDKTMGKSLGSDLASGKQTVLTVLAREHNPEQWLSVWNTLQESELKNAILNLRPYLEKNGILSKANRLVLDFINKAKLDLEIIPKNRRRMLEQFTEMVLNRRK